MALMAGSKKVLGFAIGDNEFLSGNGLNMFADGDKIAFPMAKKDGQSSGNTSFLSSDNTESTWINGPSGNLSFSYTVILDNDFLLRLPKKLSFDLLLGLTNAPSPGNYITQNSLSIQDLLNVRTPNGMYKKWDTGGFMSRQYIVSDINFSTTLMPTSGTLSESNIKLNFGFPINGLVTNSSFSDSVSMWIHS